MAEIFTVAILAIVFAAVVWAAYEADDTLHPLVYLMPMVGYLYVWMPYTFWYDGTLARFFSDDELLLVQGLNLFGTAALALGVLEGSRWLQRDARRIDRYTFTLSAAWQERVYRMSLALGGIALTLYAYGLSNVGGFVDAYDTAKGGGWASSGYLRDFTMLSAPALVLLYMSRRGRTWTWWHLGYAVALSFPLLVHGLLGARRGPTFIGLAVLVAGWYLVYHRRPSFSRVVLGGAGVGLLLLILVTFRGEIYLGSDFLSGEGPATGEVVTQALNTNKGNLYGNTYIYGTYAVVLARERGDYYWGRRIAAHVLVRPIPSALWPNKYADIGLEGLLANAGTLGPAEGDNPIYDRLPPGAAPGLFADLFVEFAWGGVLVAFLVGWGYGAAWRRHLVEGGVWTVAYVCLLAFSVFTMTQTVVTVVVRMLTVMIPTVGLWWWTWQSFEDQQARLRRVWVRRRGTVAGRPQTPSSSAATATE